MIKIHADDYGISKNINKYILETIDKGYVNSVSVIVNNLKIEEAKKIAKRKIDLHLHLCLTENISLSQNKDTNTLITKKGILKKNILFYLIFYNFLSSKKKNLINNLLKLEIDEQINAFKKIFNTHQIKIDGHQHVHLNNYIFDYLVEHPDIKEIRLPIDKYSLKFSFKNFKFNILVNILKRILINFFIKNKKLKTNNNEKFSRKFFYGILFSGEMNKKILKEKIYELSKNKNEAMILFHPGYSENSETIENLTKEQSSYYKSKKRIDEYKACMDSILKELF